VSEHDINSRLSGVEATLGDIRDAMRAVASAIERLTRLEERHAETRTALERAFTAQEKIEERVADIELKIPVLELTSSWVRRVVLGVLGVVGLALLALVVA
jgi:chromosome segregation ATPase